MKQREKMSLENQTNELLEKNLDLLERFYAGFSDETISLKDCIELTNSTIRLVQAQKRMTNNKFIALVTLAAAIFSSGLTTFFLKIIL